MSKNIDTIPVSKSKTTARTHVESRRPKVMRTLEVRGRPAPTREQERKQKKEHERRNREQIQTAERQKQVEKIISGKYKKEQMAALKNETWGHKFEQFFDTLNNTRSGRIAKHTIEAIVAGTMIVGGTVISGPLAFLAAPALSMYGTALLARTGIRSMLMVGKEWKAMKTYEESKNGKGKGASASFIRLEASVDSRVRGLRAELNSGKLNQEQFKKKVLDFVRAKQAAEQRLSRASVDLKKIQSKHNLIAAIASMLVTGGLIAKGGLEFIPGLKMGGLSFGMHDLNLDGIAHQVVFQDGMAGFVRNMTERMVDGHMQGAFGKAVSLPPEAFAGLASALFAGVAGFGGDIFSKIKNKNPKALEKSAKILVQNAKLSAWKEIEKRDKARVQTRKTVRPVENSAPKKIEKAQESHDTVVEQTEKKAGNELFEKELQKVDVLRSVIATRGGFGNEQLEMNADEFWKRFQNWDDSVPREQRDEFKQFVHELSISYSQYASENKIPTQYDDRSRLLDTLEFLLSKERANSQKEEQSPESNKGLASFTEKDFQAIGSELMFQKAIEARFGFEYQKGITLGERLTAFQNLLKEYGNSDKRQQDLHDFFSLSRQSCANSSLNDSTKDKLLLMIANFEKSAFEEKNSQEKIEATSLFRKFSATELEAFSDPTQEELFYQEVVKRCGVNAREGAGAKSQLENWLQNASNEDLDKFKNFFLSSQEVLEQLEKTGSKDYSEQRALFDSIANFYVYGMIV